MQLTMRLAAPGARLAPALPPVRAGERDRPAKAPGRAGKGQRAPARRAGHAAPRPALSHQPLLNDGSNGDADPELWTVLDLCDDEELEAIHAILFGERAREGGRRADGGERDNRRGGVSRPGPPAQPARKKNLAPVSHAPAPLSPPSLSLPLSIPGASLLSPIIKSLATDNEPAAASYRGRTALMRRLEARFRFLAADAGDTVAGRRPTYREALLRLRSRLGVACPGGLATADLEAEILLHALADAGEAAPDTGAAAAVVEGLAVVAADAAAAGPASGPSSASTTTPAPGGREARSERRARHAANRTRVAAARALRLPRLALDAVGGALETAAKVGGAVAAGRVGGAAVRALAGSAAGRRAGHEAALAALARAAGTGGGAAARRAAAVRTAQAGAASAAARYGLARGALAALSAASWALLAADLAIKAVGTDYARLSRAVVALAQVRLVKTYGWDQAPDDTSPGGQCVKR